MLIAVSQMISKADLYGFYLGIYFRGVWLILSQEDFGSLFLEVGGLLSLLYLSWTVKQVEKQLHRVLVAWSLVS